MTTEVANTPDRQADTRHQLFFFVTWIVVTALLAIGLQLVGSTEAFGDDGRTAVAGVVADYPLRPADPSAEPIPSALYAGAMWSVTDAAVMNAGTVFDDSVIEVDVTVRNTLAASEVRIPDSMVRLAVAGGGDLGHGEFVDQPTRVVVEPGQTQDLTVRFRVGSVQEPDLGALFLQIGEPNREPAWIPLDGSAADSPSTVLAAVDAAPIVIADPGGQGDLVLEPDAASVGVEAGSYRALVDERVAVVKIVVQRTSGDDPAYADASFWAIEHDGTSSAAVLAAVEAGDASNADVVTLLFAFPADAGDLVVVAGADADEQARIPVVVPS